MQVRTHTDEIRQMRRIAVELLLANHDQACPTCAKSASVQSLQDLARRLGVRSRPVQGHSQAATGRFGRACRWCAIRTSASCAATACGRAPEIQGIGAIDFAYRGAAGAASCPRSART